MSEQSKKVNVPMRTRLESLPSATLAGLIARMYTVLDEHKEFKRFSKFALVGVIGFVIDFSMSNLLWTFLPLDLMIDLPLNLHLTATGVGSAVGFTAAVTSNFIWNRYWTYPDSRSKPVSYQLLTFFGINIAGLLIRTPLIELSSIPLTAAAGELLPIGVAFAARIGNNIALMISVVVVMFWNFFVNRYWTYSDVE